MPYEAQLLYFHMILRADDDGVVEVYPLVRMLSVPPDNLRVLMAKGYIHQLNEDQVMIIVDWLEHNKIRADRKVDSIYKDLIPQDIKLLTAKPRSDVVGGARHTAIKKSTSGLPYSFSIKIRREFIGKKCPLCKKVMGDTIKNDTPSIQHNIPLSKGGKHELGNISVVCTHCNITKKDTETDELNANDVINIWEKMIGRTTDGISKVKLSKDKIISNDYFDIFWNEYPKKVGKYKTKQSFNKLKPNNNLLKVILESIKKFKQTKEWQSDNGQFIPYPATWLNQKRWEDEIEIIKKSKVYNCKVKK